MRPLTKICGVCRVEDAILAEFLGADFVGCVLVKDSPRCAVFSEVKAIAVNTSVDLVLVFRDTTVAEVLHAAAVTGVRRVQIHRSPDVSYRELEKSGLLVHRVLAVDGAVPDLGVMPTRERPVVLDVGAGGSGQTFDWSLLGQQAPDFAFVAGGINPDNLGDLLRFRPYGIDVSSGIESRPGVKDSDLMHQLFAVMGGLK